MKTNNYQTNINDIIINTSILKDEIFDYIKEDINFKIKERLNKFFIFCEENLLCENNEHDIQPARFYFRKSDDLQAEAFYCSENGYYIISIYKGLFFEFINVFIENKHFDDAIIKKNIVLNSKISLKEIMFQTTILFTFYHELTHLIQFSRLKLKASYFKRENIELNAQGDFDIESHLMEYDADLKGAHSVLFHLLDYFEDTKNKDINKFIELLSVGMACIMTHFLIFIDDDNLEEFYFKETDYPHIYLRIFYVINHFQVNSTNYGFNVNSVEILIKSSELILNIMPEKREILKSFFDTLIQEYNNVQVYLDFLEQESLKRDFLYKNKKPWY